MTQKTTDEIRTLLNSFHIDFEQTVNKALNDYLPKLFHSCHSQRRYALQSNVQNVKYS